VQNTLQHLRALVVGSNKVDRPALHVGQINRMCPLQPPIFLWPPLTELTFTTGQLVFTIDQPFLMRCLWRMFNEDAVDILFKRIADRLSAFPGYQDKSGVACDDTSRVISK
jgi:hypothetical protein